MARVSVSSYTRRSRTGRACPVRKHRRGTSFEFVPAEEPLVKDVRLFDPALMPNSASFVWLPDVGEPPSRRLARNTVYIVGDVPASLRRAWPKMGRDISTRWARILGHEALRLAVQRVEGRDAALRLGVPYRAHARRTKGDISRGI